MASGGGAKNICEQSERKFYGLTNPKMLPPPLLSAGCLPRHAAINTIVKMSLARAQIPSTLEPSGPSRSDGKRPDGATITPWQAGRTLVWDGHVPGHLCSFSYDFGSERDGPRRSRSMESWLGLTMWLHWRSRHLLHLSQGLMNFSPNWAGS